MLRGKQFHKKVQNDWVTSETDGKLFVEHTIQLPFADNRWKRIKKGRLDIFVDELQDFIAVVEIKATDWNKIKHKNIYKLLGSHRRQVWRYIDKYIIDDKIDVCAGIIYPKSPTKIGLKNDIEDYLNDYGIQVVWYEDSNKS